MAPQGLGQICSGALVVLLEDAHRGPSPQGLTLGWPRRYYLVQNIQLGALGEMATGYLLVEEVYVFGIQVFSAPLQDKRCDLLQRRGSLHRRYAGGNLIQTICPRQLLRS